MNHDFTIVYVEDKESLREIFYDSIKNFNSKVSVYPFGDFESSINYLSRNDFKADILIVDINIVNSYEKGTLGDFGIDLIKEFRKQNQNAIVIANTYYQYKYVLLFQNLNVTLIPKYDGEAGALLDLVKEKINAKLG